MRLRPLLLLPVVLGLAACAVRTAEKVAEPLGRDFFAAPQRFQGRRVHLSGLQTIRVDLTRPLVFEKPGPAGDQLIVTDSRSLASQKGLRQGEFVDLVFECSDGLPDRGNILLDLQRPFRAVGDEARPEPEAKP